MDFANFTETIHKNKPMYIEFGEMNKADIYNILKQFVYDYCKNIPLYDTIVSNPGKNERVHLEYDITNDNNIELSEITYVIEIYDVIKVKISPYKAFIKIKPEYKEEQSIEMPFEHFYKIYIKQ